MKKKIIAMFMAICMFILNIPVFAASSQSYSNFTQSRNIEETYYFSKGSYSLEQYIKHVEQEWFFPYVKLAYELKLQEYSEADYINNFSSYIPVESVIMCLGNIVATYQGIKVNNYNNGFSRNCGIITQDELDIMAGRKAENYLDNKYEPKEKLNLLGNATRKDVAILVNRLFSIIDPGKKLNNLTYVVDVDDTKTPDVSLESVLTLYNYGILTGNSYGMFTPYQYITQAEFATIICRICCPELRVKLSQETYSALPKAPKVATYMNISQKYANNFFETHNYDWFYNNKSLNETDIITKSEMLSMIFSIAYDTQNDTKQILQNYDFILWEDPNDYLTENEFNLSATKSEAAMIIVGVITQILATPISTTINLDAKYLDKFTPFEIDRLQKALTIGILKNTEEDILSTSLTKGDFTRMLTKFSEKYSTYIEWNTNKRGINRVSVVKDPMKLPYNAHMYPYILPNIPKEVYENLPDNISLNPLHQYKALSPLYTLSMLNLSESLTELLNIDYTILQDRKERQAKYFYEFPYTLVKLMPSEQYENIIEKYVDYVIENEIILKGEGIALIPIVYRITGSNMYYVRAKLSFEVVNSKTNKNLLLFDEGVTYNGKNFECYVTLLCSGTLNKDAMFGIVAGNSLVSDIVYGGENIVVKKTK